MPRGVAKAKDGGVDKKDKGDGKVVVVKRSRKMRGGGSFKEYCNKFLEEGTNKVSFKNAKEYAKEYFKLITTEMNKKDLTKWGRASKEQKEKLKILDYINITKDDNDSKLYDSINNLKEVFEYIQKNSEYKSFTTYNSKELCKHILFIKIYKLFLNFKELASTEPFSSISIDKPRSSEDKKILQGIAETIFESIPDDLKKSKVTTEVLEKVLQNYNIEKYIITEIFSKLNDDNNITLTDFTQAYIASDAPSVSPAAAPAAAPALPTTAPAPLAAIQETDDAIIKRMDNMYNENKADFNKIDRIQRDIYSAFKYMLEYIITLKTFQIKGYENFNIKGYLLNRRPSISNILYYEIDEIEKIIKSIKVATSDNKLFNKIYIDNLVKEIVRIKKFCNEWISIIDKIQI